MDNLGPSGRKVQIREGAERGGYREGEAGVLHKTWPKRNPHGAMIRSPSVSGCVYCVLPGMTSPLSSPRGATHAESGRCLWGVCAGLDDEFGRSRYRKRGKAGMGW